MLAGMKSSYSSESSVNIFAYSYLPTLLVQLEYDAKVLSQNLLVTLFTCKLLNFSYVSIFFTKFQVKPVLFFIFESTLKAILLQFIYYIIVLMVQQK